MRVQFPGPGNAVASRPSAFPYGASAGEKKNRPRLQHCMPRRSKTDFDTRTRRPSRGAYQSRPPRGTQRKSRKLAGWHMLHFRTYLQVPKI